MKKLKLCIICHKEPAEIPDREVMGRPIKKICKKCHSERLKQDMQIISNLHMKQGNVCPI